MKKNVILLLLMIGVIIASCSKSDSSDDDIQLSVTTVYSEPTGKALFGSEYQTLHPAPGVTVSLYKTYEDSVNETNKVTSGVSDEKGVVVFHNLESRDYFVNASNDHCLGNLEDVAKEKNKIFVKNEAIKITFGYVNVDQVSAVDINNYLNKSVYVGLDYQEHKELIEKGKSKTAFLTPIPLAGTNHSNYLKHTLKFYNSVDDTTPFETKEITVNPNCQTFVVDLR